jgi:hypothetical protein
MAKRLIQAFELQFEPARIRELASRYRYDDDTEALQAGQRIASGDYCRADLEAIFTWKTGGRGISRLRRNSETEIRDALQLARIAQTERAAIAVLCGLCGVEIPVASALLTAIDPKRYTIIDFRALESLGVQNSWHTVDLSRIPWPMPRTGSSERRQPKRT